MESNSWRYKTFDPSFEEALEKGSKQPRDLRVLCLACGDLRNVLFSLGSTGPGKIHLVINDYDIHVLARNILILDMIFDEHLEKEDGASEAIFSIWFSTGLHEKQLQILRRQLRKLIGQVDDPAASPESSPWRWRCYERGLLSALHGVWKKWLGFFGTVDGNLGIRDEAKVRVLWETTQEMRHRKFLARWQDCLVKDYSDAQGSVKSRLRALIRKHRGSQLYSFCTLNFDEEALPPSLKLKWKEEIEMHQLTGVFTASDGVTNIPEYWRVNPTLFCNENSYDLHYGTDSFSAFPIFLPSKGSRAVDTCFGIFKTWLHQARENRNRLSWTFSCLDCQTFCLNFDPTLLDWTETTTKPKSDDSSKSKPKRVADALQEGALVCTHGLQKSPNLNGCFGVVTGEAPESGRWGVHFFKKIGVDVENNAGVTALHLPAKPVSLKKSNLLLVTSKCGLLRPTKNGCFDVVSTSNVADHVGISTLLLLSRPLLVPGGILLTTSFLHMDRFGSTKEYLQASLLGTKSNWWTTLFGFRAMGYESDAVTSLACKVAHTDYEVFTGDSRTNATIVWLANNVASNLPIAQDGKIANTLLDYDQNNNESYRSHNMVGKVAAVMYRLGARKALSSSRRSDSEIVYLGNILEMGMGCAAMHAKGESLQAHDMVLCSFAVDDVTLRQVFCSQRSPTPTMFAKVNRLEVKGLWLEQVSCETSTKTRFFFWSERASIEGAGWRIDLYCVELGAARRLPNVPVEQWQVNPEKLQATTALLIGHGHPESVHKSRYSSLSSYERPDANSLEVCDLLSFQLVDESDTSFIIRVQPLLDFFGRCRLSAKAFQIDTPVNSANKFALTVKMRIPCKVSGSQSVRNATITKEILFSTPVTAKGWKYLASQSLLSVEKGTYNFFSTVRSSDITGCVCPVLLGGRRSGWTDSSLRTFSGLQLTVDERSFRQQKDMSSGDFKMPLLTEIKDSMMIFLQLQDTLIYIHIKEPGVGIVALVFRHGLLMDRQKCVPVLDLSVCFLSSQISPEMANAVSHMNGPDGMRTVSMWKEQYRLFQNLCNYLRATMDPALRTEHPDLRKFVQKRELRKHFRRVLMRPLFPSAAASEGVFEEAFGANLHRMMALNR